MATLKLSAIDDDKPVRITVDLPAGLHRDLVAYGEAMGRAAEGGSVAPQKLIVPMLQRFIASDRGFASARRDRR
ncbi:DUF2274 domain-containing protein [Sphingomonas donggukensis]|uniref:DUF2274 domain-containing protein n=1 Tax=Sphingomonas donggukensis TaxID=2949093 RepID=A0ABY4TV60_9SPHN|nr:DUF2274 domain-containing protein [Sphingomonas donggukensis]URW75864.1 DUF2274 domain-containing protein [Sphingomonas donggukensis]